MACIAEAPPPLSDQCHRVRPLEAHAQTTSTLVDECVARSGPSEAALAGTKLDRSKDDADASKVPNDVIWVDWEGHDDPANPFNWSSKKKWTIASIGIAFCSLVSISVSGYSIAVDSVMVKLDTTRTLALLGIFSFTLMFGASPLVLAPFSETYGRSSIYIASAVVFTLFFIPQALAKNIETMVLARFVSGIAGSSAVSLVGGTISDCFRSTELGFPMALFTAAAFASTGLGPIMFGYVEQFYDFRLIQWIMFAMSGVFTIAMVFVLRETRASVLLSRKAARLRKQTGDDRYQAASDFERGSIKQMMRTSLLRPVKMLATEPVLVAITATISFGWALLYMLLVAIPIVLRGTYGFSIGQAGLAFTSQVIGSGLGLVIDHYCEKLYHRKVAKRGPEARLYQAMVGGLMIPVGAAIFSFTAYPHVHWIACLIGVTILYAGMFLCYLTCFAYLADAYSLYASSALSAMSFVRNLIGSVCPLFTPQMYSALGIQGAGGLCTGLACILMVIPFVLYKYGLKLRERSPFAVELRKLADAEEEKREAQKAQSAGEKSTTTQNSLGTRATRLELDRDYNQAFQLYVKAAQQYMYLVRHCTDASEKARMRQVSSKLIERATRIKQTRQHELTPVVKSVLAREEQDAVLERSSFINGHRFQRWRDTFEQGLPDNSRQPPPMSAAQLEQQHRYQSLSEVLPQARMIEPAVTGRQVVQDNVADCSLVSALIIGAEHHAKFGSRVSASCIGCCIRVIDDSSHLQLGFSCLYPQDGKSLPRLNTARDYAAKLLVNGALRAVSMDDSVPVSTEKVPMCAMTESRDQLWPALVEKAYLRVMGGYEFSGSNSGNDLYALSGWIPEHISLRSGLRSERTWDRVRDGFESGACVLTLGTPKETVTTSMRLAPLHSYAVLNLREDDTGRRPIEITNPWRQVESAEGWVADIVNSLPGPRGSGTFTLDWDELPTYFEALHVSWDPSLFSHEATIHCSAESKSTGASRLAKAQFVLQLDDSQLNQQQVWLLLSRHVASKDDARVFMGLNVATHQEGRAGVVQHETSSFQDNDHLLCRFQPVPSATKLDVFVSSQAETAEFAFTLRAFATCPVAFAEGSPALPYSVQLEGSWDGKTAGGNHACPTFLNNPQYRVKVLSDPNKPAARARIDVGAQVTNGVSLPINVRLVRGGGRRVGDIAERDVVAGSSQYSYGSDHVAASDLAPGMYTIIVSSFESRTRGDFSLSCESSIPIELKPIPQEGDGMYVRTIRAVWNGGAAQVSLELSKRTSLSMRLRARETPIPLSLCVVDNATGQIPHQSPVTSLVCGLLTNVITLEPKDQGYTIRLSTPHRDCQDEFELLAFADKAITVELQ
ncbi:hypothetical protein ACM66B_000822 [Microbotryomycetes sp. NB124-2]